MINEHFCRNDKERVCALFFLANNKLIPYRNIGTGLSMTNEDFRATVAKIEDLLFEDTKYILELNYSQKTQKSSLLVDQLLSLPDKESQAVYMSMLIECIQSRIKDQFQDGMKDIKVI